MSDLFPPVPELFDDVIGQEAAVSVLRAAARNPVHAYLFVGPIPGLRVAARAFAAALLCPEGGCGHCEHCRRARAGTHPDLVQVERTGVSLGVDEARRLVTLAQRRPLEAERQVLVVADVHLAARAAPALLKTVEEPPPSTVFVLLAASLPPELSTIVSRCVEVDFPPVPAGEIARWLAGRGVAPEVARLIAEGAGGDPYRAGLLAEDPAYVERLELWRSIPARLDGTGAVIGRLARQLLESAEAGLAPLRTRHAEELQAMAEEAEAMGERGLPGRKDIQDRQHREERRWRTEELRAGLGALTRSYRDRLSSTASRNDPAAPGDASAAESAIGYVRSAAISLDRNPNETLLLEALLVRLSLVSTS